MKTIKQKFIKSSFTSAVSKTLFFALLMIGVTSNAQYGTNNLALGKTVTATYSVAPNIANLVNDDKFGTNWQVPTSALPASLTINLQSTTVISYVIIRCINSNIGNYKLEGLVGTTPTILSSGSIAGIASADYIIPVTASCTSLKLTILSLANPSIPVFNLAEIGIVPNIPNYLLGNSIVAGNLNATGDITGNNINATGNITGNKINVTGTITNLTNIPSQGSYNTQQWSSSNSGYSLTLATAWTNDGINYNFIQKSAATNYPVLSFNKGNVGIGTTIPDTKLAVKGIIHAEEVRVDLNVPGPDYVFETSYKLPSLKEVSDYIQQNKHLPEVPAASVMEANGVNLGEMNMLLLKKVEELTLYMIEQQKINIEQDQKIEELEKRLQNSNK